MNMHVWRTPTMWISWQLYSIAMCTNMFISSNSRFDSQVPLSGLCLSYLALLWFCWGYFLRRIKLISVTVLATWMFLELTHNFVSLPLTDCYEVVQVAGWIEVSSVGHLHHHSAGLISLPFLLWLQAVHVIEHLSRSQGGKDHP